MWDNMIKDRIWFVFMKHWGSSKRRYRAEWRVQRGPLRHCYCHPRRYHSISYCFGSFTIHGLPVIFWSDVILVHIFHIPPPPQVTDCRNTQMDGMARVSWWHSPELVPRKRIQRSTNMSSVLQLQAVIQNCLGAQCQLPELLPVYCRVDGAKIAVMDCGFELVKIFQQEPRWIFKLHIQTYEQSNIVVALNYISSLTSNPQCIWILIRTHLNERLMMSGKLSGVTTVLSNP